MSGSNKGESDGTPKDPGSSKNGKSEKKGRKSRPSDVGRALRTVYDDTLREAVPDDFMDLLGKLS